MPKAAPPSGSKPAFRADSRLPGAASADPAELRRFASLAGQWWDEAGPLAPLHKLNPTRLSYIRGRACARFGRDPRASTPLADLEVLDVGCGGGLLSEPLARLGAGVTGIDLEPANLRVAAEHAAACGIEIDYRDASVEQLAAAGASFDLVCVMEVVEHVADQAGFLDACARLVRPGGGLVLATLNRTFRAFALGIVAAEYVLRWLPPGTHSWSRFLRPSEAARPLRRSGLAVADLTGVSYDPLRDRFRLSPDPAVNYMLFAVRD
jgi:2-polyprenyl-6-hydroxyphenyl methylase/3-demethylubiquinone-9 3-methyltransferase